MSPILMVLINTDYRWEEPKSSPSYPSLLMECDLSRLQSVQFPSDVGHDTQERSFLALTDKTVKT